MSQNIPAADINAGCSPATAAVRAGIDRDVAYGAVTPEGFEALRLLATSEGVLLDPVYTAKAMAGLIHDARQGRIGRDDTVVFLHTGGLPAVFAYRDDLLPHLGPAR